MKGPVYKRDVSKRHKTNEFSVGCLNCAAHSINVCLFTRSTQVSYFLTELMFTDITVTIRGPMTITTVLNVDQNIISWWFPKTVLALVQSVRAITALHA